MTYISNIATKAQDSPSIDAFGRWRVSNPESLFDSKQVSGDTTGLFWDDIEFSGTGTSSTYSQNRASLTMGVSASTAGRRVRQTYQRFNYLSGKSQLIFDTFVMGTSQSGVKKRTGYFNENNGLFLMDDAGTFKFVRRTFTSGSAVDNEVAQSAWNYDKMDGTGRSKITLDFTKSQILFIDFEWLGVGRVRMGFVVDGKFYIAHTFDNANNLDLVYMSTPNLPMRHEIEANGTNTNASTFEILCCSVQSEGGNQSNGVLRNISREENRFSTSTGNTWQPLISVRLKSTSKSGIIDLLKYQVVCASNATFETALFLNPTIAGTDAASWVALGQSSVEYDISRDNTNLLSGGYKLQGAIGTTAQDQAFNDFVQSRKLGFAIDGTADEIVLAVKNVGAETSERFYATMDFKEAL